MIEPFKKVVGRSRQEVSLFLTKRFRLEVAASARIKEFGVETPWQAFAQVRLQIYQEIIADPEVLLSHRWSHNIELLHNLQESGRFVGLATMSHCQQAPRVLDVLGLHDALDFVATRDDVEQPKLDPEIFLLVARELGVVPRGCLVIEDSPTGVQAALAAGMAAIAVTTPFTRMAFRERPVLERRWIVDDSARLPVAAAERLGAEEMTT